MKTVMDIDWSEAPEGFNYATVNNKVEDKISFYNEVPVYEYELKFGTSHTMICFGSTKYNTEYYHAVERPQTKPSQPVFTQAMADNGELPQVGIECNFETTFFTTVTSNRDVCKPIAYHADKVWLDMFDSEYVININVIEFKPIDTRTDKEKAIDEITKEFIGYTSEVISAFEFAYNKWVGE